MNQSLDPLDCISEYRGPREVGRGICSWTTASVTRKTKALWTALLLTLLPSLALLLPLVGCSSSAQLQSQLVAAWRDGDEAFRKTQFDKAAAEYRLIVGLVNASPNAAPWQADRELAEAMIGLCETLEKADRLIATDLFPESSRLQVEKACQRVKDVSAAATVVEKQFQLGGQPAGRDFSPADRASDVAGWAVQRLVTWQARWSPAGGAGGAADASSDARQRWEDADRLLALARQWAVNEAVWKAASDEHQRIAQRLDNDAALAQWRTALADCLAAPTAEKFDAARAQYAQLRGADSAGGTSAPLDQSWSEFLVELKPGLRAAVRNDDPARLARHPITRDIQRLSLDDAFALNRELLTRSADAASPLVFLRVADRCYAIEARSGRPRWVVRVGYEVSGLPLQMGDDQEAIVVLAWHDGESPIVSSVRAMDGDPKWTVRLTQGTELAGPLMLAGGGIYAATRSGQLWRLDPNSGSVHAVLTFPEPLSGPLVVDSDARRALVMGRDMACYVVPLELPARVASVFLWADEQRFEETHGIWASPYVLLARNTGEGRAEVHVLAEPTEAGGGQRLQRLEIAGRVWQTPVQHAQQWLLTTDQGDELVYGVDVNQPQMPLYELHRRRVAVAAGQATGGGAPTEAVPDNAAAKEPVGAPAAADATNSDASNSDASKNDEATNSDATSGDAAVHPPWAVHPDGGFLVQRPGVLEAWALDVAQRSGVRRDIMWERRLREGEVGSQPLQVSAGRVYAGGQIAGTSGARLTCIEPRDGSVIWECAVGVTVAEVVFERRGADGRCSAMVRTSDDTYRLVDSPLVGAIQVRPLPMEGLAESLTWAATSRRLAWVDTTRAPQLVVGRPTGRSVERLLRWPLSRKLGSPLSAHEPTDGKGVEAGEESAGVGTATASSSGASSSGGALWLAGIDTGRRLMLAQATQLDRPPQFQNLPPVLPEQGWYRPIWVDARGIVVGHPRGHLLSASLNATGQLPFLSHASSTLCSDQGILGPPLRVGDNIWLIDRAGVLQVRAWPSLAVQSQVELSAPASPLLLTGNRVSWGTRDGAVMQVPVVSGKPGAPQRIEIGGDPVVQLAWHDEDQRLIAIDGKGGVHWVRSGGTAQRLGAASSPPTIAPLLWHDSVCLFTEGGAAEWIGIQATPR